MQAENEALRAELIEARKTIKLLKLLDAGVPADLTQSDKVRKAAIDAELKDERDARDKERAQLKKTEASVVALAGTEPTTAPVDPPYRARVTRACVHASDALLALCGCFYHGRSRAIGCHRPPRSFAAAAATHPARIETSASRSPR